MPPGNIVPWSVQQNASYLCEGGPHTDPHFGVERYCGITTSANEVRFNVGARPALPAVEPLSVGGVLAADTSVDPSQTTCEWVTQRRHGRCLAQVKMDIPWQRVVRRKAEDIKTGDIIEDTPVSDHADPYGYRKVSKRTNNKTTFYYDPTEPASVGCVPAADAKTMPTTLAVPAPDGGAATGP